MPDSRNRGVYVAAHAADRTRRPVHPAERIDHGAVDAPAGKRVKRHAKRRFVTASGFDEPHHADTYQLIQFDVRRDTLSETRGKRLHEANVRQHEPVAGLEIWRAALRVRLPASAVG
jgi:hypothetical protein